MSKLIVWKRHASGNTKRRYYYLTWLLTALAVMVFLQDIGAPWLAQRFPRAAEAIAAHPAVQRLASGLTRLQKSAA